MCKGLNLPSGFHHSAAIASNLATSIGSIVVQIILALSSPKEANAPADERERIIQQRAGHWSGIVLATGVVLSLGHYLARGDGNMLFHLAMASLIVAQIAEYAIHILLVRRSF